MKIQDITDFLETIAPPFLQEDYDNSGLITGNGGWDCTGVMISLDATEQVVLDAIAQNCNLIVAHHPIVFSGLKKITGGNYVERTVITAIKHDIAIFAIHTNLDNIYAGVNGKISQKIGLKNTRILMPKKDILQKLSVFVPIASKQSLMEAVFSAGAGDIGNYSECSFSSEGTGSFKAGSGAQPFVGAIGERHYEKEEKLEIIFPAWLQNKVISAMKAAHPYEEVAYDLNKLANSYQFTGSGMIGELEEPVSEAEALKLIGQAFDVSVIRHTAIRGVQIKKIALCGGAGSFLTKMAIAAGADMFISSDFKYHEFFDAENKLLLADIGHYESEQFTVELLFDLLREKFPNFAHLKMGVNTNPVHYYHAS
jgi:dinuclear metal center YbgI/SA1388 family protein